MSRKVTRFTVPVDVRYDSDRSSAADAVEDFYRALMEAEQAGFLDRTIIDISYGGPDSPMGKTDAYDADLETEDDDERTDDEDNEDAGLQTVAVGGPR